MAAVKSSRKSIVLGGRPIGAAVRDPVDVDRVFDTLAREPNGGLMVLPDISMTNYREAIVALAARHRVPAIYPFRFFLP
jgi:putative ABC transport system substrate-binding protein